MSVKPATVYGRRKQAYERLQQKQQQAANRLSDYRLFSVILGIILAAIGYRVYSHVVGAAVGLLTLVLFGYLAYRHARLLKKLRYAGALASINRKGSERTAGHWTTFADSGAEFRDHDHPYAADLDLFGQASLFQWVSSAQTSLGREVLARFLKERPPEIAEIGARQEAVTELARKLTWRQWFEAEGLLVRDKLEPAALLIQWGEEAHPDYLRPLVRAAIWILPVLTIATIVLWGVHHLVPWQAPVLLLVLQGLLLRLRGKELSQALSMVYRLDRSLRTYAGMLQLFENQGFEAQWLRARREQLRDAAGRSASAQIHRLAKLAERISNRENAVFIIVNVLLLWDYHCMVALEEWKAESGPLLKKWLAALAEVEALSSLANIRFEHPEWSMPTVDEADRGQLFRDSGGLSARNLGHPLITQGRVANDFELKAPARIVVITGSNMSGKSTFLRTVGINLVLAYTGAPVCADQFRCSAMALWTCMRVSDNLEQNISSFYAELLRIKRIVEAARAGERVYFLLDEIFKGTNSRDRHEGAKALITQLQKDDACGLISTHDLELGDLERASNGRIRNFHFREYYEHGEIRFDYTLRPGISTTRNALYLIRMAGIDLDDRDDPSGPK